MKTRNRSTPKMGVSNKMYKYSTPSMGKGGKNATPNDPFFAAIGSIGQKVINADRANVKAISDKRLPPGTVSTGKGTFKYVDKDLEKKAIDNGTRVHKQTMSIFGRDPSSTSDSPNINSIYSSQVSTPAMGPLGAAAGATVGSKIGSFIGSAGRLIGKKHEKYGRLAGEYIGGSLGGALGALYTPI